VASTSGQPIRTRRSPSGPDRMRLLLGGAALLVSLRLLLICGDPAGLALLHLPLFVAAAFALPLSRRGHRRTSAQLMVAGALATNLPLIAATGGLDSGALPSLFALGAYTALFIGWRWLLGLLPVIAGGLFILAGPLAPSGGALRLPLWADPLLIVEAFGLIIWCGALHDHDLRSARSGEVRGEAQLAALVAELHAARAAELERIRHQATLTRVAREALAPEVDLARGPDGASTVALDVEARSTLLALCASASKALNAAGVVLLAARADGGWSVVVAYGPDAVRIGGLGPHESLRAAADRAATTALGAGDAQPAELRELGLRLGMVVGLGSPRRAWGLLGVLDQPRGGAPSREDKQLLHSMAQLAAAVIARARDAEALRHKDQQLHRAQRMEPIGLLAGGIAHDFNNYVQVIMSYAAVVRESLPTDDPAHEDLREIELAAERAGATARQLLDYGRKRAPRGGLHDLNELVRRNAVATGKLLGEHIAVHLELMPRPVWVNLDADELSQVLMNLMVNARDAMQGGGVLRIETEADPAARLVRLVVADTGCGMDAATQARVFEPFFTTKGEDRGTGLGLSTCAALVRGWGGEIGLRSTPGAGTRFELKLPLERRANPLPSAPVAGGPVAGAPAPSAPSARSDPPAPLPRRGGTILVVEDDEQVRIAVVETLRKGGYTILDAATPEQALALARGRLVDLLLTDLVLPGMNGVELYHALQTHQGRLSVLYITGYSPADLGRRSGAPIPAGRLLTKPFRPSALLHHIEDSLADDAPVN
jgi:two-component system cell cycle sensor histidine kinase/response regulator CckA